MLSNRAYQHGLSPYVLHLWGFPQSTSRRNSVKHRLCSAHKTKGSRCERYLGMLTILQVQCSASSLRIRAQNLCPQQKQNNS